MNEIVQHRTSQSAAGPLVFALSAAMATGHVAWPVRDTPIYVVPQTSASYSPFVEQSLILAPQSNSSLFAREIARVYASMSEGQEPLGADFEAVWDANVDSLYEA
jgi:hypothetical protein